MSVSLWTKVVSVALIAIASVVGSVSVSASEFKATPTRLSVPPARAEIAPAAASADDDVRIVPAVFARDPHTQFLFARHVSKWM